jgi:hypothetical protein
MRRRTGTTPGDQGRFAGYDVLAQLSTWDEVTAGVVLRRLGPPQPLRFFSPAEQATATALLDHLLDQWDEPKVPVLAMIDQRLVEGSTTAGTTRTCPPTVRPGGSQCPSWTRMRPPRTGEASSS